MRIPACIMGLFLIAAGAQGEEETAFSGITGHTGFGAPVFRYTRIHDQNALMIGGRGGWTFNHSLMLGGGGYGVVSEVDGPEGALDYHTGPLDIEFGYLGFEAEYIIHPTSLFHYSLYTLAGGGADNYVEDAGSVWESNEQIDETDFFLVLEPGVTGELNVTPWFRLNMGVFYRVVNGIEQKKLENGDFGGISLAVTFKFGRF